MPEIEYDNFLKINLYKLDSEFRRIATNEKVKAKKEFIELIASNSSEHLVSTYSTVGTRSDADFMLIQNSKTLETFHALSRDINQSLLGSYLQQSYSYLSIRRKSRYKHGGGVPKLKDDYKYMIVYPMTKTRPWYGLLQKERQDMMNDHFRVGKNYPMVKINTSYAFGLDDTEFVLSFEMDDPSEFTSLVMDLREVPAAQYTLNEIPIFTTIKMPIDQALDSIA
ncbi:MAG: chlorite dismutase family protein [SAR202 cluster bacterium]|nr:chlorite dismutase [Chloroflexota bacterium]MBG82750.1 chlorite dismutase [Chloroflexota bacterium]MQG88826.1 chlorite dismutase family protein [SAR202 cluster bacterium]|tara:strand:- start:437 stop:1108 length:672 start_codon:yes stop_codon:yes gene_type:complete